MSQQSTMKTVLPYFARWTHRFPKIEDLAEASAEDVLKMWAGLGYYSRARNVHATAKELVAWRTTHEGRWPERASEWQSFKGIGPYTAAAVASIAFGDASVPVDGNVLRVGARVFALPDPLNSSSDRKGIEDILAKTVVEIPKPDLPIFGQSLMELGALVCRPGAQALCEVCPLNEICEARIQGRVAAWPIPKKRPVIEERHLVAEIFWDGADAMIFRKIPLGQRLEGQWELPLKEIEPEDLDKISKDFSVLGPVTHTITRYKFKAWAVMRGPWKGKLPEGYAEGVWREPTLHLTTLTHKLLSKIDALLN
ncbi:MAG: hypothetical protein ABIR96_02090 [Bdellovibrionota bacterium]